MPQMLSEFTVKHILVSNDPDIEKIAQAIAKCQARLQHGKVVGANTVICFNTVRYAAFEIETATRYRGNTYLSKPVPLVVTIDLKGELSAVTNTQFTYGLDYNSRVKHFESNPGLIGGTTTKINLFLFRKLQGIRIYRGDDFPGTRGFTARESSATQTGKTKVYQGDEYNEVRVISYPAATSNEGELFYVKAEDWLLAPSKRAFMWGGQLKQL